MRSRALLSAPLAASIALGLACERSPEPRARTWPSGTVLALGDRPIPAAEVDASVASFALLEPRDSFEQLRRLALTNVVLPRCAAEAIDPEARREAQQRAAQAQRELAADRVLPDAALRERTGRMLDIGLELWFAVREKPPGVWTDVVETAGCFQVARLVSLGTSDVPADALMTVQVYDFPYLPLEEARKLINAQLDRSRLVYVDESWRAFVPLAWQSRLKGGSP